MLNKRRLLFFCQLSLIGFLLNSLSIQAPIVVPFLLGNVCILALALRLNVIWGALALLLVLLPVADPIYWLSSALQLAVSVYYHHTRPKAKLLPAILYLICLIPPTAVLLPLDAQFLATVVLLTFSFVVVHSGALMLFDLTANKGLRKQQSLQQQLSGRIATYATMPFGIIVLVYLNGAIVNDMAKINTQWSMDNFAVRNQIERQLSHYLATVETSVRYIDKLEQAHLLKDLVHSRPEFISALITDNEGKVIDFYKTFADEDIRGISVAYRPYFYEPKVSGLPFISDVFQGQRMGKDLLFAVSAPYFEKNQFAGVIELSVSLPDLNIHYDLASQTQKFELLLLDKSHKTIWSSNPLIARGTNLDMGSIQLQEQQSFFQDSVFNPSHPIVLANQGKLLLVEDVLNDSGWSLLLYASTSKQQWKYHGFLIIALSALMLFMSLIRRSAAYFVRSYTDTLTDLIQHMGNFSPTKPVQVSSIAPLASTLEFERLASSFLHMQRRIFYAHKQLYNVLTEKTQLSAELEIRVQHRTRELEAERDRATQLASAKSQFLANMSHELRTPLAIIRGYCSQLLKVPALHPYSQALTSIDSSCHFLLAIVNDILDSAQLEEGKLKIEKRQIALLPFLQDIQLSVSGTIAAQGLKFEFYCPDIVPESINTDPFRLKQILMNLLGNAMKFTHQGFIQLHLVTQQQYLEISVIDSGIGISEQQQLHIFEAFEQADLTTTRQYGGSGLGLYICKKLAAQLDIDFTLHSELGKGSKFSLRLAMDDTVPWSRAVAVEHHTPSTSDQLNFDATVLVVEDVPELRQLFCLMLEEFGIKTLSAENGQQALTLLNNHSVDLILMDLHMPIKDGAAALSEMRQRGDMTPVVMLTADAQEQQHIRLHQAGCQQVLTKPMTEAQLLMALQTHLTQHRASLNLLGTAAEPPAETTFAYDDLQVSFMQSLGALQQKIQHCWQQKAWPDLHLELHKLKGTAACLDFADLSEAAAEAGRALKQTTELAAVMSEVLRLLAHYHSIAVGDGDGDGEIIP